ncbi:uncharacterized protein LOC119341759 [Triticum dicoccoides]|uniref:uncharacterized protein LOC119341759 n=1 Tax=Triticum dicoccoides TaxID=85692 RepID=UPI0018911DAD|nr:uncharacterized protein LOC119341759 [Triticum dicoccoides]
MPSSPSANPGHGVGTAAVPSRTTGAEGFASILDTQGEIDALCREHGVPEGFTALPAGDLRANSTPPPGAICVYARALEAGMRVPLHGFFLEALAHFGLAPAQLTPNGWRMMAGFLALCRSAGVPRYLAVFRHFFLLSVLNHKHRKGWYFFRPREGSGLRFTGMPNPTSIAIKDWKREFFFLSSPDPWPCAVEWVEPSKSALMKPVLTAQENKSAAKLLRVYGGAAVDLRTYLSSSNLAAAMIATTASPPPPPPPSTPTTPSSKGMDPAVHDMIKVMLAEKAAAQASASASAVKAEPGSNAALCGEKRGLEEVFAAKAAAQAPAKKRIREEARGKEEVPPLSALNTPLSSVWSPPPGFSGKSQHIPSRHDGDSADWVAARELLQGAVAPPLERAFAANAPSEVVKSTYAAILQAANYASFSFRHALELEEKLAGRERKAAALREQLEEAKAELAAAKQAAEEEQAKARDELEKAKGDAAVAKRAGEAQAELAAATAEAVKKGAELAALKRAADEAAAVQQLLGPEERVRRRAEHALEAYERWRGRHAPAGRVA